METIRTLLQPLNARNKKSTVALRFLMLNGLSILFFALLYYFCGRIIDHDTLQKIQTTKVDLVEEDYIGFFRCLHFSLVTQSTIGYGDLICSTYLGYSINCLQTISTFLINAYILYLH